MDLLGKRGRDYADGQRDHNQAAENRYRSNDLSERGYRHHIAISDGAQGHDRPPQGIRKGAELVRLHAALGEMHEGGRNQGGAEQDDDATEQGAPLGIQGIEQRADRRGIARELQEPDNAENKNDTQLGGNHEPEPERQDRHEVDDAARAGDETQPRARRTQMPIGSVLDRNPHPQQILRRENHQRKRFDHKKLARIKALVLRYRFERDRDKVDVDQHDQQPADEPHAAVADRTVFKNVVNP